MFRPAQNKFAVVFGSVGAVTTFHGIFRNDQLRNKKGYQNFTIGVIQRYEYKMVKDCSDIKVCWVIENLMLPFDYINDNCFQLHKSRRRCI